MISASATSTATSTSIAFSSGIAVNNLTGETATATSKSSATATATATATSDTFNNALNNAIAIASNNAIKIASENALTISNDIALEALVPPPQNPFYPLTILEQQNISNYVLNNILAGQDVPNEVYIDLVALIEPTKSDMIIFKNTGLLPVRKAEVCVYYITSDIYNRYEITLNNEEIENVSEPTTLPRTRPTYSNFELNKVIDIILSDPSCRETLRSKGLSEEDIDTNIYIDVCIDSRLDLINKLYGPNFSDFIYKTTPRPRVCYATPFWSGTDGLIDTTRSYIQPISSIIFFVNTRTSQVMKIYDTETVEPIQKEIWIMRGHMHPN